jgi:hypothetical protein
MDGMGQIGTRNGFGLGFGFWSIQSGMVGTCMCIVFVPLQRHGRKIYTYLVVNDPGPAVVHVLLAILGDFPASSNRVTQLCLGRIACALHTAVYTNRRALR